MVLLLLLLAVGLTLVVLVLEVAEVLAEGPPLGKEEWSKCRLRPVVGWWW